MRCLRCSARRPGGGPVGCLSLAGLARRPGEAFDEHHARCIGARLYGLARGACMVGLRGARGVAGGRLSSLA